MRWSVFSSPLTLNGKWWSKYPLSTNRGMLNKFREQVSEVPNNQSERLLNKTRGEFHTAIFSGNSSHCRDSFGGVSLKNSLPNGVALVRSPKTGSQTVQYWVLCRHTLRANDAAPHYGHTNTATRRGPTMKQLYPSAQQSEIFTHYHLCMKACFTLCFESNFIFAEGITEWLGISVLPSLMRKTASNSKHRP